MFLHSGNQEFQMVDRDLSLFTIMYAGQTICSLDKNSNIEILFGFFSKFTKTPSAKQYFFTKKKRIKIQTNKQFKKKNIQTIIA